MARKLGQITAVRENTWMIRIPLGCDPETHQRSYYNRTVHGSLRRAQKFLGKKINQLGASCEIDGAKIRLDQYLDQWLKAIIGLQSWVIARLKQLKEFQARHPVTDPEGCRKQWI